MVRKNTVVKVNNEALDMGIAKTLIGRKGIVIKTSPKNGVATVQLRDRAHPVTLPFNTLTPVERTIIE